ncbi:MAG: tRNA (guanosine(46)-N7)-methyltransferase TrmB [Desulfuromonadaceae bacterium]|nr:tRNA (guanosine(46)-N7)-methyltransferase TrmB [Desulfuromonadaceae bacterium]
MTQRTIEITSPVFADARQLDPGYDLQQLFPQQQPLALEIGCGIGDFIVQLASAAPDTNFLAIDIYNKGCLKTCRRVERHKLSNVRVLRMEARYLLSCFGRPESLRAVYINCPDPWPKKRHRDRRLVSTTFLTQLLYYLEPDGNLFFATDIADYAEQVAEQLAPIEGYLNPLGIPLMTELAGYPLSKYMRRFLELGQPIHYIHRRRRSDFQLNADQVPRLEPGFRNRHTLNMATELSACCPD